MPTLYIRDVPEAVTEKLKKRAASHGQSLSAYVAAELSKVAERPTNAEIAVRLAGRDRSAGPTRDEIVAELEAGRR